MKVGLVCPYNVLVGGGVQECVFALADELERRGHDVVIISPRPRRYDGDPPKRVRFIGLAAAVKSFHTTAQISASAENDAIETMLDEEEFDVIHFHEPWVPFVSRQILSRSSACNIATFHAKLPENRMNKTIERVITPYTSSIVRQFDALTAVSDAATDYVHTLTDRDITIIPNGIDLTKYAPRKITAKNYPFKKTKNTKNILFVGRLERRKGLKYLLDAFHLLQSEQPDIALHIVGSGPDERRLKRYILQHDIKAVHFYGYVSEAEKIMMIQSADVFCSPAPYGESFGIVLLEAMRLGTPIVAGDNPGYTAVMKDIGSLSIVNPKNASLLASRLSLLLDHDELTKLWKKWAQQYVKQYSYRTIVDQYETLYQQACQKRD